MFLEVKQNYSQIHDDCEYMLQFHNTLLEKVCQISLKHYTEINPSFIFSNDTI